MAGGIAGLVEEQHSVGSGLLDHLCVNVVAVRPGVGVFVVSVGDQAGEVRLLVARGGIVEGEEGGRHGGDRDEETSLHHQLVPLLSRPLCAYAPVVPGCHVRRSSRSRQKSGGRHRRRGWRCGAGSGFVHHARSAGLLFEGVALCIGRPMANVRLVCLAGSRNDEVHWKHGSSR